MALEQAADSDRRSDQAVDVGSVHELVGHACRSERHGFFSQLLHLPGRHGKGQLAGGLEVTVDAEPRHVGHEAGQVLLAEAAQQGHLVGPSGAAVAIAMGERRRAEPSVATGGILRQPCSLEE